MFAAFDYLRPLVMIGGEKGRELFGRAADRFRTRIAQPLLRLGFAGD